MSHASSQAISFFQALQQEIIDAFETLEPTARFEKTEWEHIHGGGGKMQVLRGNVFEKAAVNWSGVHGETFPMDDAKGPFFATGISLITHMKNPHLPTVHMNLRYIETATESWIGGGYDLTPMGCVYPEDKEHFHKTAKKALDTLDPELYPRFFRQAQEYFFLPHRGKERGMGGIFFDHHHSGDFMQDFALLQTVGASFLPAILPIYQKRQSTPYSPEDLVVQSKLRAHYVEFNLLYDRGTKFGFSSRGNPEAILCSLPPSASW